MKNYVFSAPTKNKNTYFLEKKKYVICYMHPELNKGEQITDKYYKNKHDYLKKHIFLSDEFTNPNQARLSSDLIKKQVANLNQLVFEVTDACNLKCKYCGYGDIYNDYDKREGKKLNIQDVMPLFNYLLSLWNNEGLNSFNKVTYIGFYGGEPLLNMNFIEAVVD